MEAVTLITGVWMSAMLDYPGFRDWKLFQIDSILNAGDPVPDISESHPAKFAFPSHIERQLDVITALFGLARTWQALTDTQFYFRRYPFNDLPVSLEAHLQYICEAYHTQVYEFRERLKILITAINKAISRNTVDGKIVKCFDEDFNYEIRIRHFITHHASFKDPIIERIDFEGMFSRSINSIKGDREWREVQRRTYRKASKLWAHRAELGSEKARLYLNAAARLVIKNCRFLSEPPKFTLS